MCAVIKVANASGLVTMVGHLFQNYDTIYVRFFCHVYLRSFLLCGFFIPKYMTIFLQTRI